MADTNLYQNLLKALQEFKAFLDDSLATIKPTIQVLRGIIPAVGTLIDNLINLMGQLKTAIQNLNVGGIPGLDKVTAFTADAKTVVQTGESLIPDQKSTIDDTLGLADVVGGLPQLDPIRNQILSLIDSIVAGLNNLKS